MKLKFTEIYQFIFDEFTYSGINLIRNSKDPMIVRSFNVDEVTPYELQLVQKLKRINTNCRPK